MLNATAAIPAACVPITAHDGTILCSWSDNPCFRGTLNILWLCVSTLGLCVWNAVHPDVPYPGSPKWRVVGKRVWWLFVGLFMPEMLVLTALGQFQLAYRLLVQVSREARVRTELPWWMTVMERLRSTPSTAHETLPSSVYAEPGDISSVYVEPESSRKHSWTLTHSFYAVMHGFIAVDSGAATRTTRVLHDGTLEVRFHAGKNIQRILTTSDDVPSIPDVSADDLDDRSKAGAIAKALLVWQFSAFIANCAARWNQHLPLSLLEITTLAHSLCSLVALILWWYKPHSVCEATVIHRTSSLPLRQTGGWWNRAAMRVLPGEDAVDVPRTITILAIAVLYGLPHLLGLSVHFPTTTEQLCWQIATFTVICSPLIMCAIFWIMLRLTRQLGRMEEAADGTLDLLILILVVLYATASMFLVGESVRQIFALPAASFHEPQLTRYLPSFS